MILPLAASCVGRRHATTKIVRRASCVGVGGHLRPRSRTAPSYYCNAAAPAVATSAINDTSSLRYGPRQRRLHLGTFVADNSNDDDDDATSPDASTMNSKQQHSLEENTNKFLDPEQHPVGTLTVDQGRAATNLFESWISLPPSDPLAKQSVPESIRLLERLIQEQAAAAASFGNNRNNDSSFEFVNLRMLTNVMGHWEQSLRQTRLKNSLPTPVQMLAKINRYNATLLLPNNNNSLHELLKPNTEIHNFILNGFWTTVQADPTRSLTGATKLVKDMVSLHISTAAAANTQQKEEGMKEEPREDNDKMLAAYAPNTRTVELLLQIYIRAGAIQKAVDFLDYILAEKDRKEKPTAAVRLGGKVFEGLLQACAKSPSRNGGRLADQIMERMLQCYDHNLSTLRPEVGHYTQVMQTWVKSEHPHSGQRCMDILQDLKHQAHDNEKKWLEPDDYVYGAVIHAWAKLGAGEKAETVLEDQCHQYQNATRKKKRLKPDITNFNSVLNAWAKSREYSAGERAETLVRFMQEKVVETEGKWNIAPDIVTFNCAIQAWGASRHPEAGARAEKLFQEVLASKLKVNERTCSALLHVWAKDGNVEKAARLLGVMCTEFEKKGNANLEPNIRHFSVVLDALAKSGNPLAGQEAERLLRKMEASGRRNVAPDTHCYNTVINAYAQSGDQFAGREAERLLREMSQGGKTGAAPDLVSYNSTINAFAGSKNSEDADRLLRELQGISENYPNLKPDTYCYNCVLNAHAKNGNAERAESLLSEMNDNQGIKPDFRSFSAVLEAWSRSGSPKGGEKADLYLAKMEKFPEKEFRYKLAHICWGNSRGHDSKAEQRLKELTEIITHLQSKRARGCWQSGKVSEEESAEDATARDSLSTAS